MADENIPWSNSFEANIQYLFDELRLAIYWQRPSILIAVHHSAWGQKKAVARLQALLVQFGCVIIQLNASAEQPSIAHRISNQTQIDKAVFFVFNLDNGGDDELKAYRALNMYRELFIENRIKVVFWLSRQEAANVPFHAPDFWAFRHRVIGFGGSRNSPIRTPWYSLAIWYAEASFDLNTDEKISALEKTLEKLPTGAESRSLRIRLLYELGYTYWLNGQVEKSLQSLNSGFALITMNPPPDEHLCHLNARAILYIHAGQPGKALEIFKALLRVHKKDSILRINFGIALCALGKNYEGVVQGRMAVRLEPDNPKLWNRLGYLYISAGKLEDAMACFKESIHLMPSETNFHESLAVCYYLLGWTEKALLEFDNTKNLNRQSNIFADIYREAILGNLHNASVMLNLAIQNGKFSHLAAARNPNLNLILDPNLISNKAGV